MSEKNTVQVERICQMEEIRNAADEIMSKYQSILEQFVAVQDEIRTLSEYYGSAQWYTDREDYDAGKLPLSLKCGVLGEDLVYNLLEENHTLAIEMLECAAKILK